MHDSTRAFGPKALFSTIFVTILTAAPASAVAHHAMDGAMPTNFAEGLISGLAHPVIGLDHLAFILGVGLLAAVANLGAALPLLFVAAMGGGLAFHIAGVDIPYVELLIAATVVLVGVALMRPRGEHGSWLEGGLFALAGIFHGYAFAESIIGAEATPLWAYIAGLVIIQSAIALSVYWATRFFISVTPQSSTALGRLAGIAIVLSGTYFAATAGGFLV